MRASVGSVINQAHQVRYPTSKTKAAKKVLVVPCYDSASCRDGTLIGIFSLLLQRPSYQRAGKADLPGIPPVLTPQLWLGIGRVREPVLDEF